MAEKLTPPLTAQQQEQLVKELAMTKRELERSRRKIQNLDKASRFLVVVNENAERVRDLHEKELMRTKQKAEEASQAKSTFLAQMSHEMRTPMNAIKVLSELLLRTELDKLQKDYAQNIVNATGSLLAIINDILDFSKLESNKYELVNAPYDFISLISDVSNIVNLRALDKNIAFITDIDPTIPSMMEGDDLRLKQVLLNLLQNGVKYTNEGYVKLIMWPEENEQEGYITLCATIKDSGIGIKEETKEVLFEAFTQVDKQKNRNVEGTGLGLSIAKSLLELAGGEIWLDSVYGEGSEFHFRVPQLVKDATPIAHVSNPEEKNLLLGGELVKIQATADMCEHLGMKYDLAGSADIALDMLRKNNYTHFIYGFEMFQNMVNEQEELLGGVKLIATKDIRYAGRQHTRPSISVLFRPILVHEIARAIEYAEDAHGYDIESDADEIGRFATRDVNALIVDDNEVNLMVLSQLLKQYNIECKLANSGMDALELCQTDKYDLIFMDHMMPIMNGVEAAKRIRGGDSPNMETPIIVVTANAIVGVKEEFLREGLDDYISKPIDIKELNVILKRWLPAAKIKEIVQGDHSEGNESSHFIQGLAGMGLNSIEVCDSMGYNADTYMAIIETFISSVPATLVEMVSSKKTGDLEAFRIQVHGIKSALANIGAASMSRSAQKLEHAAKEANEDYINLTFPVFYDELSALVRDIKSIKPQTQEAEGEAAQTACPPEVILQYVQQIGEALDELDSLLAIDKLAELTAQLDAEQHKEMSFTLNNIKISVENFDYEAASEQMQHLLQCKTDVPS